MKIIIKEKLNAGREQNIGLKFKKLGNIRSIISLDEFLLKLELINMLQLLFRT